MEKARTIEEMIRRLEMCTGDYCYLDVMRESDIPVSEYERHYRWNDERYTRNLLVRNDKFELVLICWEKGQTSYIHDYNAHDAWVHPISGTLREECYVKDEKTGNLEKVSSVQLGPKDFNYMGGTVNIHSYKNENAGRSVSLHLYAKPVDEWTIYTAEGEMSNTDVWWDNIREEKPTEMRSMT